MLVPVSSQLHGLSGYILVPTNKYVFVTSVTKVKTTLLVLEIICKISLSLTIRDGIHLFIKIRDFIG